MNPTTESPVARLWRAVWFGEKTESLDEVLSDPYVRHTRDGTVSVTIAAYLQHMRQATRNVRGIDVRVDQLAESDDRVFARLALKGVNITTGDPVTITVVGEYRVADGRIAESWSMHQPGLDWS